MSKTQAGSLRSRIIEKLIELQEKHGTILTPKHNMPDGPAKDAFVKWYLNERKDDVAKNPDKDYTKWAMVHVQDSMKHRKEAAASIKVAAAEPVAAAS